MAQHRIPREVVDLDPEQVRAFFEHRGETLDASHPITSVLYQDQAPEIAIARDAHERSRILPLLELTGTERVLDVGCGIGRWARHLGDRIGSGLGLDISSTLLNFARSQTFDRPWRFEQASADQVSCALCSALGESGPFDLVLLSGVCIYLNDDALDRMLAGIAEIADAPGARIYVREPVGEAERLTLKEFFSTELRHEYSAIYRTRADYAARFERAFGSRFAIAHQGPMYEGALNNRRETFQYFWILRAVPR